MWRGAKRRKGWLQGSKERAVGALDLGLEGWVNLRSVIAQRQEKHSEPRQWHEEDAELGRHKAQGGSGGLFIWLEHRGVCRSGRGEAERVGGANLCCLYRRGSVEAEAGRRWGAFLAEMAFMLLARTLRVSCYRRCIQSTQSCVLTREPAECSLCPPLASLLLPRPTPTGASRKRLGFT